MTKARRATRTDGDITRSRILEAAGSLFAATGYAETTSKAIAAHAGVDLASINYHFGSRSHLYQTLLIEAHRRMVSVDELQALLDSALPARVKVERIIDKLIDATIGSEAWHTRLFARELLAPSSHFQALYKEGLEPKFALIRRILGEVTNIPEEDPALSRCMISIAAPCLMLLVAGTGAIPGPPQQVLQMPRQAVAAHLHRFALAGLQAISRDYHRQQPRPGPKRRAAKPARSPARKS